MEIICNLDLVLYSLPSSRSSTTVDQLRQYNAIFFGLPECNSGTHHLERTKLDFDRVADVCSKNQ